MASPEPAPATKQKACVRGARAPAPVAATVSAPRPVHVSVLEEARRTGSVDSSSSA